LYAENQRFATGTREKFREKTTRRKKTAARKEKTSNANPLKRVALDAKIANG